MNNLKYDGLELKEVLAIVAQNANFEASQASIMSSVVDYNPLMIRRNIEMTSEAMKLLKKEYSINFYGIEDVRPYLYKTTKGQALSPFELLACLNFHKTCLRIKKTFDKIKELDILKEYTDSINIDYNVFNKIDNIIDINGKISKNASAKLTSLYEEETKISQELNTRAKSFMDKYATSLQEDNIFYRDDRLSFLLKNSDKYKYEGFLHGSSASGQASYVEPKEFVDLNNARIEINIKKDEEIEKILVSASYLISTIANLYESNFETLTLLDVIFAKAQYGISHDGVLADITNERYLLLEEVCHPLIDIKKVVANTYELKDEYAGILISGANTGGKTVSLKLIGLSVLMTYLGIPIIGSKAIVPIYDGIYVDIDDNQSLESSLSTFSSQLVKLNEILNHITSRSLVLIDELGNGTEPKQAQALSIAIVEKLLSIHCNFVLTTHFDELKNFAMHNDAILVSAVSFDEDKLIPTYHYIENSVGSSNALKIASYYLDDKELVNKADEYIKNNATAQEKLLKALEEEISRNKILNEELNQKVLESSKIKADYEKKLQAIELSKQSILEEYQEKINTYLDEKIAEINRLANNETKINKTKLIKELDSLREEELIETKDNKIEVGDNVRIKDSEQIGEVIEISGNNASININGIKIKTKLNSLTKMPKRRQVSEYKPKIKKARVNRELVLVGMHIEEAMPLLEKYLDDAYAAKMTSVRIVHGIGTGRLKMAVHNKLKKLSFVKDYHLANYDDGGSAITIVELQT